jgi:hypothetical protein
MSNAVSQILQLSLKWAFVWARCASILSDPDHSLLCPSDRDNASYGTSNIESGTVTSAKPSDFTARGS